MESIMSELSVLKLNTPFTDGYTFFGENTYVVIVPKEKKEEFLLALQEEFDTQRHNNQLISPSITKLNSYFKELFNNRKHTRRIFFSRFKREDFILNTALELEASGVDMEDLSSCIKLARYLQEKVDNRNEENCINDVIDKMGLSSYQVAENIHIEDGNIKQ